MTEVRESARGKPRTGRWILGVVIGSIAAGQATWSWSVEQTEPWLWAALATTGAGTILCLITWFVLSRQTEEE